MLPQSRQLRTCTIPSPQALAEALKTNGSVSTIYEIGAEGAKARSATECSEVKFPPSTRTRPKAWSGAQKPKAPSVFVHNFRSDMSDGIGGLRV